MICARCKSFLQIKKKQLNYKKENTDENGVLGGNFILATNISGLTAIVMWDENPKTRVSLPALGAVKLMPVADSIFRHWVRVRPA